MHFIPVIETGVALREGYELYEDGIQNDIFIKAADGSVLIGN